MSKIYYYAKMLILASICYWAISGLSDSKLFATICFIAYLFMYPLYQTKPDKE